jgi:hypothetical protein
MADLVIDEWLWSDLAGENSTNSQRETFQFLEAVFTKCDRIVTVKGSRFEEKALGFWKLTDVTRRGIAKFYKERFWYNSDKCLLLDPAELQHLEDVISNKVKADDRYLVRACLTSKAMAIVTTDNPLRNALDGHGIPCRLRQEFVPEYITKYGHK